MGRKRRKVEPSLEEKRERVNEELAKYKAGIHPRTKLPVWVWLIVVFVLLGCGTGGSLLTALVGHPMRLRGPRPVRMPLPMLRVGPAAGWHPLRYSEGRAGPARLHQSARHHQCPPLPPVS
jgi:hypothetical protein